MALEVYLPTSGSSISNEYKNQLTVQKECSEVQDGTKKQTNITDTTQKRNASNVSNQLSTTLVTTALTSVGRSAGLYTAEQMLGFCSFRITNVESFASQRIPGSVVQAPVAIHRKVLTPPPHYSGTRNFRLYYIARMTLAGHVAREG
jgi:hypothetical protein